MSDPPYQNVIIQKPVPGPRQQKANPPAAQLKPTSNKGPNASDNSVSFVSLIGQMSIYTEEFSSCSRLSKFPLADAASSNNWTHRRYQANESDDADCNNAAMISFTEPVYKIPRSCTHQTSDKCCHVPPIPPRKHIPMNSSQQDLFNWIPPTPPQSMSPAAECRSRTLAHNSSLRTVSQNSCLSLPRQSPFLSPSLTDSVPLLQTPEPKTASGYVPHKPKLDFLLGQNGYLDMKKQSSATDYVTKPPFDDLLSPNDQIGGEDDPEYFSTSELYADEPLYQVYHKGAVVRDVIEQALEDEDDVVYEDYETLLMTVLDRTSRKRVAEMGRPDVTATIENLIPSAPGLRRFWVDTPQVKNSGILENFSSQERKHQECIFEIITSEASYLKSLKLLEKHFMENPRLKPPGSSTLSKLDYQHLFSNVKNIISVSNRLLQKLELVWKRSVVLDAGVVCRVLKKVAKKHYGVYVPYLTNAAFQERKLSELNHKLEFQSIVTDLEDAPVVNGLKLQSFLVLPMQRITRIPLLIYAVLQGIELEESVVDEINDCLNTFQTLLNECNEKARQMENLQQLNVLNSQLKFKKTSRTVPIVSQTRSLIKKGQLIQIKPTTKLPVQVPRRLLKTVQQKVLREKLTARHFFLFNDLLLISKKKNDRCFEVIEFSERRNISAEIIDNRNIHNYLPSGPPSAGCSFLFCLAILDEENSEFVLSCDSENERMRWIEAFCPSSQNDEDERVYELNDCPQVQAVQKFLSEEPDELGLEESDVVNVLRKTQDGWYEGERIRDGRRGWFLASHTVEIENAHRRAKNRRQRWRLLKQTEQFQERSLT